MFTPIRLEVNCAVKKFAYVTFSQLICCIDAEACTRSMQSHFRYKDTVVHTPWCMIS